MPNVECSHIQITLSCNECGHQWDHEDYDNVSVDAAVLDAEDEPCPKCEDE
jgi:hypothetical protein